MKKVLTYGTFDTLHFGHIRLLERARALGDYLVVGLSTDEFNAAKGKRALHSFEERKRLLLACRYVDEVIPEENWEQKTSDVANHGVSVFTMGDDWAGEFDFLKDECEVVYLSRTPDISSTLIRQRVGASPAPQTSASSIDTAKSTSPKPSAKPDVRRQRVLVFPCGSEAGLEIHAALKYEKSIDLVGASSVEDHGKFVYRNYVGGLPFVSETDFLDELNRVIEENEIDWIFPAYDDVLLHLSANRDALKAPLLTSNPDVVYTARSKQRTYDVLDGFEFVPETFENADAVERYPVFLKPDIGQGSQGIFLAKDRISLDSYLKLDPSLLICEYLPGDEFTVDCFSDRNGRVLFCGARKRARVKSGISVGTFPVELDEEIRPICEAIMERLPFRGAWFFQVKRSVEGKLKLLEVAPRIAGSMGGFRNWGINFPALTVYDFAGHDVKVLHNPHSFVMDRSLFSRYSLSIDYDRVYIDFDDTITNRGHSVNPLIMLFLYQCRDKGKSVVLVTRHAHDIHSSLEQHGIAASLFDRIIHLRNDEPKSSVMEDGEPAIFIDDSFREREDVLTNTGIPVFAVDAIEALIDWRH